MFKRRVFILSLKNKLNWSAESMEGEICWDKFDRRNILSMECQRDLDSKHLLKRDEK